MKNKVIPQEEIPRITISYCMSGCSDPCVVKIYGGNEVPVEKLLGGIFGLSERPLRKVSVYVNDASSEVPGISTKVSTPSEVLKVSEDLKILKVSNPPPAWEIPDKLPGTGGTCIGI